VRKVKKTFSYTRVTVEDAITGEVLHEENFEGVKTTEEVVADYFKSNPYRNNLTFEAKPEEKTFVISADDFMKYGEEIQPTQTTN